MPPIESTIFLLVKHHTALGLAAHELELITFMLIWQHEHKDVPLTMRRIARGLLKNQRTLQVNLRGLEAKQFLITRHQLTAIGDHDANQYDFSPLIHLLEEQT